MLKCAVTEILSYEA